MTQQIEVRNTSTTLEKITGTVGQILQALTGPDLTEYSASKEFGPDSKTAPSPASNAELLAKSKQVG